MLALSLFGAAAVAVANAACDGTYAYDAGKNANYGKPPLIIGDSTIIYAAPLLANRGFISNARGCRFWDEGLDILRSHEQRGSFGKVAVLALGTNGYIGGDQIDQALEIVGKRRLLGLVTPVEAGGRTVNAEVMRDAARAHPNRILLIDWLYHSKTHPEWFEPDGIHVDAEGAEAQARFYAERTFKILRPAKKKR